MAWGDTAKLALDKAVEAYKEVVRLGAVVDRVDKAIASFERRIEERLEANDRRATARIDQLETRVRDLERQVASLGGKVDGGFAKAIEIVLGDEVKRKIGGNGTST